MSYECTVTLVGNLTREPELRFTQGGKGVASFGIAVNRRFQVNGEWTEKVSFFNLTAWDTLGENAAATFKKGDRVIVTGRLEQSTWDDKEGNKKSSVEVVVDDMGPSLRWARAEIEKVSRDDSSGGNRERQTTPQRQSDPVYGDEEPF